MGINTSKINKDKLIIVDYNKVKLPKNYNLLKLSSYNVDINNSINISDKIKEIFSYIHDQYKNKGNDIICIQGMHNFELIHGLIESLKKYSKEHNEPVYFAPCFDEINSNVNSSQLLLNNIKSNLTASTPTHHEAIIKEQNIIISKYPIITSIYGEFNNDNNNVFGKTTLIGANISINGDIISVYNTLLCKDIDSANIINSSIRSEELKNIFGKIQANVTRINSDKKFIEYHKTGIHLLVGALNIVEKINNMATHEYEELVQLYKCIDVFRYFHETSPGYTNKFQKRTDYMMFILGNELYDESSESYDTFQKIETEEDLYIFIFNKYKLYFLDIYIRNEHYYDHTTSNFPVECIFALKKSSPGSKTPSSSQDECVEN